MKALAISLSFTRQLLRKGLAWPLFVSWIPKIRDENQQVRETKGKPTLKRLRILWGKSQLAKGKNPYDQGGDQ